MYLSMYDIIIDLFSSVRWTTVDDQMAAETPAFFCTTCFKMLHYTIDGKKVTDFQAYPFFDELSTLLESAATTSKQI